MDEKRSNASDLAMTGGNAVWRCIALMGTLLVAHGCVSAVTQHPVIESSAYRAPRGWPASAGVVTRTGGVDSDASSPPKDDTDSGPLSSVGPDEAEPLLPPSEDLPSPEAEAEHGDSPDDLLPIDLPAALRLAGANNLQIALAVERVREARARLMGADALWLPSLDGGVGYNLHRGQIQDTRGDILDVQRSSLFVGGGPNLGGQALNGGTNGPARLALGLPLTDAIFEPLAECQLVQAAGANRAATFNDSLLAVAIAYLELVRADGQVAIAREAVTNAKELVRLVEARVRAGTAPPADELRAQAELADRRRKWFKSEEIVRDASAELVRLLHLPPGLALLPAETQPVAIDLVDANQPLPGLIGQGLTYRPELAAHQALVRATLQRLSQEKWRPLIPNLELGLSAGGFGGGRDGFFGDFDSRTDFDALAVWELRGMGFGNAALVRERRSEHSQAHISTLQVRDTVAAEVTRAYYQVRFRKDQIDAARQQVDAAAEALPLNFKGILGGQLRAIEALQAIDALTAAQSEYLTSIIDYNRAQFQLLRALGIPPEPIEFCSTPIETTASVR